MSTIVYKFLNYPSSFHLVQIFVQLIEAFNQVGLTFFLLLAFTFHLAKMCWGCSPNARITWSFIVAGVFIALSITIGVLWPILVTDLIHDELKLIKYTTNYKSWIERPFPIFLDVYMFNWTNIDKYETEKPNLVEVGPYVFMEMAARTGVQYNREETVVAYNQTKVWTFRPDLSNGLTLSDKIVTVNPIAATISYFARQHPGDPMVYNLFDALLDQFGSFATSSTVGEWMFDGFEDPMLTWLVQIKEEAELPEELEFKYPYST